MKEHPILFSGPMVRALQDGSKTQTRRVVKPQPTHFNPVGVPRRVIPTGGPSDVIRCPYGQPGDRLWVRESWQFYDWTEDGQPCARFAADNATTWPLRIPEEQADRLNEIWAGLSAPENYSIDNHARDRRWRPSIHMPRWASRITLEITGVRVERLQDISEADARAEGVAELPGQAAERGCWWTADPRAGASLHGRTPSGGFRLLWEQINGPTSWDANPWVWVVEFRRLP